MTHRQPMIEKKGRWEKKVSSFFFSLFICWHFFFFYSSGSCYSIIRCLGFVYFFLSLLFPVSYNRNIQNVDGKMLFTKMRSVGLHRSLWVFVCVVCVYVCVLVLIFSLLMLLFHIFFFNIWFGRFSYILSVSVTRCVLISF